MKEYTHISISLGIGLLMLSFFNIFIRLGFFYIFLGLLIVIIAKLNDWLDFRLSPSHKRVFLTHSPLSPLLISISLLIGLGFMTLNILLGFYLIFVVHSVFTFHIILDALNPTGVPLIPGKERLRLKKTIPYDNFLWNLALFLLGVIMSVIAVFGFLLFP